MGNGIANEGWRAFCCGCLRRTLAGALDLEHFKLNTDLTEKPRVDYIPPLREIFLVDTWARLRYLGLFRFHVRQHDMLSFLAALPPTLRSVELSFLRCVEGMRDQLGWRQRPVEQRLRVIIGG